jgi:YHS domain-containing protein
MCAVNTSHAATTTSPKYDYAGVRYGFCCADCVPKFQKDPAPFVASAAKAGTVIGLSLFDPVSGKRIALKAAKGGSSNFMGTRFLFESAENKSAFDANPKGFGLIPEKVALYCPVMGHAVKSYAEAGAMADHGGVRYFLCCPNCLGSFKENPGKYTSGAAKAVMTPKPMPAPKEKAGA